MVTALAGGVVVAAGAAGVAEVVGVVGVVGSGGIRPRIHSKGTRIFNNRRNMTHGASANYIPPELLKHLPHSMLFLSTPRPGCAIE